MTTGRASRALMCAGVCLLLIAPTFAANVTASPSALTFGNQVIGTKSDSRMVTVKNNQTASLTITSITTGMSDYTYTTGCPLSPGTLGAGQTCTIAVSFTPAAAGPRRGTLTVSTSAGNPTVSLSGTGVQPAVVFRANLVFAGQPLGTTSEAQTVTLTNNQTTALRITGIVSSLTDFGYTSNCPLSPSTLAGGASCTASVTFSPQAIGTRSGSLSFNDNASNSPQLVSLTGTGNPAALASISVTPATASIGVAATQQYKATGTYTDGTSADITSQATWSSSATGVATISKTGLATGVAAGSTTISAAETGISGPATLTVTGGTAPPPPTGPIASAFNAQVSLSWNASSGATSYNLYRSTVSGGPYSLISTTSTTSMTDGGVHNATTYYYVVTATGAGGTSGNSSQVSATPQFATGFGNIQHIVFIIKENRTFDNYFGTYPGAEGATSATISTGQVIPLAHTPDRVAQDIDHSFFSSKLGIDYGRMDKFDLITNCNLNGDYLCLSQLHQDDLPNYWTYAQNFVLADHMFSSLTGGSFPNHLYTIANDSGGTANNPYAGTGTVSWGCDAPAGRLVDVVDDNGNLSSVKPCFDFQTLADSMQNAGLTWRYYSPAQYQDGYAWNALNSVNHIRNTSLWNNIVLDTQFEADAQAGNLPALSWIVTDGPNSEHPTSATCAGENRTVQEVNAVMQGPLWNSTAIFVTWDDFGGFYDHVPPPVKDTFGLGLRVPLLIISPYVNAGYLSHTQYEFASILKFAEERFGLSPLGERDTNANDTLDSFNLTQPPLPPLVLQQRACSVPSPMALTFPLQQVNTTGAEQHVAITNYSTTSKLTISSVSVTGDFASTRNCPSGGLTTLGTCSVSVTFTPKGTGVRTGTVTIYDNDPSSPQVVTVTGTGSYVALSTGTLAFPMSRVGIAPAVQSVTLTNNAATNLGVTSITTSGDYSQTNTCGSSVLAGKKCTVTVTFNPTTPGTRFGGLTINNGDGASPHTVNLTGVGTNVSVSPTALTFAPQTVGTSTTKSVTITNQANASLSIGPIAVTGTTNTPGYGDLFRVSEVPAIYYSQTNNCGTVLAAGSSCTVQVTFTPNVVHGLNGALVIKYEAADSPQVVAISASGK